MASKEPFLPLPTEEDLENALGSVPTVATYSHTGPGSSAAFGEPMSVDVNGDELFPNISNYHTLCFNCCCDFRRAVLIVNAITIGVKLLVMMGVAIGISYIGKNLEDVENDIADDDVRKQVDSLFKSGTVAGFEIFFEIIESVSIGLHACGIYGALKFKRWGIVVSGTAYALNLFGSVISADFGGIIVSSLFLYPHIQMYNLMKVGIMTDYNYHKVASCCGDKHM
jgi:hypothetical protein